MECRSASADLYEPGGLGGEDICGILAILPPGHGHVGPEVIAPAVLGGRGWRGPILIKQGQGKCDRQYSLAHKELQFSVYSAVRGILQVMIGCY